ncbi:MAG: hypothetical protein WC707_01740 [Candidatus Babeliaceae bacterium]|jgi:hypothetical protein
MTAIKKIIAYIFLYAGTVHAMVQNQDYLSQVPDDIMRHIIFFVAIEAGNIKSDNNVSYFDDAILAVENKKYDKVDYKIYGHKDILQIRTIKKMACIAKKYNVIVKKLFTEKEYCNTFWHTIITCLDQQHFIQKGSIQIWFTDPAFIRDAFIPKDNKLYIGACCNSHWLEQYVQTEMPNQLDQVSIDDPDAYEEKNETWFKRLLYVYANLLRPFSEIPRHITYYTLKDILKGYPQEIQKVFEKELYYADIWNLHSARPNPTTTVT